MAAPAHDDDARDGEQRAQPPVVPLVPHFAELGGHRRAEHGSAASSAACAGTAVTQADRGQRRGGQRLTDGTHVAAIGFCANTVAECVRTSVTTM